MTYPDGEQLYFMTSAWEHIQKAHGFYEQKRRAKAQQYLQEAMYFEAKIRPEFIDSELQENITRLGRLLSRGY